MIINYKYSVFVEVAVQVLDYVQNAVVGGVHLLFYVLPLVLALFALRLDGLLSAVFGRKQLEIFHVLRSVKGLLVYL